MDTVNAKLYLENLIERIERDSETGKLTLPGSITENETESLRVALRLMTERSTVADGAEPEEAPYQHGSRLIDSRSVTLNLDSMTRNVPDSDVTLCLDFGTAMSKAAATRELDDDILMLPLGKWAGEPGVIYPVSSTLYIGNDEKIYFGHEAIEKSRSDQDERRSRFDSPKQHLSQGELEEVLDHVVGSGINPTDFEFTNGELIVVYLSFLTDLACLALNDEGVPRYVRRRYARPRWPENRAVWSDRRLRRMLAEAQVMADTFGGEWKGGIDASRVHAALVRLKELKDVPRYLIDDGVLEAIAAASGCLSRGSGTRRDGKRELYMIVDVGAGTTDYGLFTVVTPKQEGTLPRIYSVADTSITLRQAGDKIDDILLKFILDKSGILPGSAHYPHLYADLRRRIRFLKESLFRDGEVSYSLTDDSMGQIGREEFLEYPPLRELAGQLENCFCDSLRKADRSWLEGLSLHGHISVNVVLAGGGADLPMVKNLASLVLKLYGITVTFRSLDIVSERLKERYPDIESEFPQLAVSIGGASQEIPEERSQFRELGITRGESVIVTNYKGK